MGREGEGGGRGREGRGISIVWRRALQTLIMATYYSWKPGCGDTPHLPLPYIPSLFLSPLPIPSLFLSPLPIPSLFL
jgi:hypothetical protein